MLSIAATASISQAQAPSAATDPAVLFGAQPSISNPELSPDGKRVVFIGPGPGTSNLVFVTDIAARQIKPVARADGQPLRLTYCGWSDSNRLVCSETGATKSSGIVATFTRLMAMDADGTNILPLARDGVGAELYVRQHDGAVLDWLGGTDGKVLMVRAYVPEMSTGTNVVRREGGAGVDLLDTRTLQSSVVERPAPGVSYMSDGRGMVRLMARYIYRNGLRTGEIRYFYRVPGEKEWRELGTDDQNRTGIQPLAVDPSNNIAYALKSLDGRRALYRIALDGSLKTELAYAHPQGNVNGVVTIGRSDRVIGVRYTTDRVHIEYLDPDYKRIAMMLGRAMTALPNISFVSASADEQLLLVFASSSTNPGKYYVFDRSTRRLDELLTLRPELENIQLTQARLVNYPTADGATVSAYLLLPPGVDKPQGLPVVVMPHGAPIASRDVSGFDWWAQYYASRGFAVLQPVIRRSMGLGDDWLLKNGFANWDTAVGDIKAGGRWLISQGIADPDKLVIAGWSHGGYLALQSSMVDPDLYKAVVAIGPVTDLQMLKNEAANFTDKDIVWDSIGSGPHIDAGSPLRHPERFKAPTLLFHGDADPLVEVDQSQAMDKALRTAGKRSELIVYPKLDHRLLDNTARTDMLRRSYEFLRTHLKL